MKKSVLTVLLMLIGIASVKANFNIWGSAIALHVNGNAALYNTQKLNGPFAIGNSLFEGNLGVFGSNSGGLKILGAEINTTKSGASTICSGKLWYLVYPQGNRPNAPIFNSLSLTPYCNCSGNSFNNCGGGACFNNADQKFQNLSKSIDLTSLDNGSYTIEIYYSIQGDDGTGNCSQTALDDASGSNYKANFTISTPLAVSFLNLTGIAYDKGIKIKWTIQNDADILDYVVEKSDNGMVFNILATLGSIRYANSGSYLFTDEYPMIGTNYYRIKARHQDGSIKMSNVFRIYYGKVGNTVFIFPNPTGSALDVRFAGVKKGHYRMSVLTSTGQTIAYIPVQHDGMDKTIQMELPQALNKGIYFVFLIDKFQFYKQSFLVK